MSGDHVGFVVAAYSIAALVLAGMIGFTLRDYRRQSAKLAALGEAAKRGAAR